MTTTFTPALVAIKSANQCLFCTSRRCYYRIHTADLSFDHVACNTHSRDMERYADHILGTGKDGMSGTLRSHNCSSSLVKRGVKERKEYTRETLPKPTAKTVERDGRTYTAHGDAFGVRWRNATAGKGFGTLHIAHLFAESVFNRPVFKDSKVVQLIPITRPSEWIIACGITEGAFDEDGLYGWKKKIEFQFTDMEDLPDCKRCKVCFEWYQKFKDGTLGKPASMETGLFEAVPEAKTEAGLFEIFDIDDSTKETSICG